MSRLILNRRRSCSASAAGASGLLAVLAGCDQFDFLGQRDRSGARFSRARQRRSPIRCSAPDRRGGAGAEYRRPKSGRASSPMARSIRRRRTRIRGAARRRLCRLSAPSPASSSSEISYSLDELMNMPNRSQITRHDCVEGWSCIAKWSGTRLGPLLDQAGVKPAAKLLRLPLLRCDGRRPEPAPSPITRAPT
jgi:hypothetical protein